MFILQLLKRRRQPSLGWPQTIPLPTKTIMKLQLLPHVAPVSPAASHFHVPAVHPVFCLTPAAGWFRGTLAALLCLAVALAGTGCGAFKPGSASFASVAIKGHSSEEIARVTAQVFQEDGYVGGSMAGQAMVFQKEGSRMQNLAYEGVVDTHYGASTLVRVKVNIVMLGEDSRRLQCQAYIVKGAGDAFFEEEQRLANFRSGPYQSLLNKVAKQLK